MQGTSCRHFCIVILGFLATSSHDSVRFGLDQPCRLQLCVGVRCRIVVLLLLLLPPAAAEDETRWSPSPPMHSSSYSDLLLLIAE